MVDARVECRGPVSEWAGPLAAWLDGEGVSAERSVRTMRTFARFSSWMSARGLSSADLSEDVVDEYIAAEQERSGSPTPAAFQYLPLVKRFLAGQGVLVLRGPVSRERHGLPRLLVGPLSGLIVELVAWLKSGGYAQGTVLSVAETGARLSAWMAAEGLGIEQMDDVLLARFVAVQARGPVPHPSSAHRIVTVRKWLLDVGLLTAAAAPRSAAATPAQQCLTDWGQYLQTERGIGRSTVAEYQRWVQGFVAGVGRIGRLDRLDAGRGRRGEPVRGRRGPRLLPGVAATPGHRDEIAADLGMDVWVAAPAYDGGRARPAPSTAPGPASCLAHRPGRGDPGCRGPDHAERAA